MKLNNKGFAVSTFMYMILLLAMILILATLAILSSRRMILDKQKNNAIEEISQSQNPICEAVGGVKSLELGTEYVCEVKDETFFHFYVLSLQGNKVNLIMDRNICEDGTVDYTRDNNFCRYAWYTEGNASYGPIVAMQKLYNATKNWTNIPNLIFIYNDEGERYNRIKSTSKKVEIVAEDGTVNEIELIETMPLKARIPKNGEMAGIGCEIYRSSIDNTSSYGTCPKWIVKNLRYTDVTDYAGYDKYSNNISSEYDISIVEHIVGYWNLSSHSSGSSYSIFGEGAIVGDQSTVTTSHHGIRPVITVPKSMLK